MADLPRRIPGRCAQTLPGTRKLASASADQSCHQPAHRTSRPVGHVPAPGPTPRLDRSPTPIPAWVSRTAHYPCCRCETANTFLHVGDNHLTAREHFANDSRRVVATQFDYNADALNPPGPEPGHTHPDDFPDRRHSQYPSQTTCKQNLRAAKYAKSYKVIANQST